MWCLLLSYQACLAGSFFSPSMFLETAFRSNYSSCFDTQLCFSGLTGFFISSVYCLILNLGSKWEGQLEGECSRTPSVMEERGALPEGEKKELGICLASTVG